MAWQRPAGEFPKIWHHFQAPDKDSDKVVTFVVQDLPEKRFHDAIEFMLKNFIPDEPLYSAADIANDSTSCKEMTAFWLHVLQQKMSLACFKEGSTDIIGINLLLVRQSNEKDIILDLKGEKWSIIYGIFNYVSQQFDACRFYNVEKYLSAVGLSVQPKFRRRGIAGEILKARVPLCKDFDIKLTSTIFSAIGSQVPAARVGFVENYTIDYSDLPAVNPRYKFAGVKTKSLKTMSLKIE